MIAQFLLKATIAALVALTAVAGLAAASTGAIASLDVRSDSEPKALAANGVEPQQSGAVERSVKGNPLWAIPLEALSATRERPLFSPSRRPPLPAVVAPVAPPAPIAKPAEPERPQLSLLGTIASAKGGLAIFLDQSTNRPIRLKRGDSHNGWTLNDVRRREVVLQKDNDTAIVAFAPNAAPPAPPAITTATTMTETEKMKRDRR